MRGTARWYSRSCRLARARVQLINQGTQFGRPRSGSLGRRGLGRDPLPGDQVCVCVRGQRRVRRGKVQERRQRSPRCQVPHSRIRSGTDGRVRAISISCTANASAAYRHRIVVVALLCVEQSKAVKVGGVRGPGDCSPSTDRRTASAFSRTSIAWVRSPAAPQHHCQDLEPCGVVRSAHTQRTPSRVDGQERHVPCEIGTHRGRSKACRSPRGTARSPRPSRPRGRSPRGR